MPNKRQGIGKEIRPGHPQVLDLRQPQFTAEQLKASPARLARWTLLGPTTAMRGQGAASAPGAVTQILIGIAYDLFLITLLGYVAIGTPYVNWVFLAYALVALIFRLSSQRFFRSALICLILIPTLSALRRGALAETFAIFAFYFLAIGVIRAMFELKSQSA